MTYDHITTLRHAEDLVRTKMRNFDPSHDALHVWRVRRMALRLARSVFPPVDIEVVELGALFHDLQDHKYAKKAGAHTTDAEMIQVLASGGMSKSRIENVIFIAQNTSYSHERRLRKQGLWKGWFETCRELHCVQDADRLDAIGSFGVFRVMAYSAVIDRPLYYLKNEDLECEREFIPGMDTRSQNTDSAIQHYMQHLMYIKDSLKTDLGRRVGEKRHLAMVRTMETSFQEYELADFDD